MANERLPLVAILRGINPSEIVSVAEALLTAGVEYIEVPLNSPEPFRSIEKLVATCGTQAVCGAGTVMTTSEIEQLHSLGANLVVSPHINESLIQAALKRDMLVLPGVATVSEAIRAIEAGANHLKLFPAGDLGARYVSSIKEVLPKNIQLFAVGHISLEHLEAYWHAGTKGFGIGSGMYRPGDTPQQVHVNAKEYVACVKRLLEAEQDG